MRQRVSQPHVQVLIPRGVRPALLIVLDGARLIWQRVIVQQGGRRRADAGRWNLVVREGQVRQRIVDRHQAAAQHGLRKIAAAFQRAGEGDHLVGAVLAFHAREVHHDHGLLAGVEQFRNAQRAAKHHRIIRLLVGRLGHALAVQGKGTCIETGVVQRVGDHAAIAVLAAIAAVAQYGDAAAVHPGRAPVSARAAAVHAATRAARPSGAGAAEAARAAASTEPAAAHHARPAACHAGAARFAGRHAAGSARFAHAAWSAWTHAVGAAHHPKRAGAFIGCAGHLQAAAQASGNQE